MKQSGTLSLSRRLTLAVAAVLLATSVLSLHADDRGLFTSVNASPYVFMILDLSGSMTWHTNNTDAPYLAADDPASRLYQAKRAIYQVLEDPSIGDSLNFGWATFERGSGAELVRKHWIYTPDSNPSWYPSIPLFGAGNPVTFGEPRNANDGVLDGGDQWYYTGSDANIGVGPGIWQYRQCNDETDSWQDIQDFPKLGNDGNIDTVMYFDDGNPEYRIVFDALESGQSMGDPELNVRVRIWLWDNSVCRNEDDNGEGRFDGNWTLLHNEYIRFIPMVTDDGLNPPLSLEPFGDVIYNGYGIGYERFNLGDYDTTSTCSGNGWESNFDSDYANDNPLSYDRETDPLGRGAALARGDVIPWDWEEGIFDTENREEILYRLAPNLSIGEPVPDFRIARYWSNQRDSDGLLILRPEFEGRPPLTPAGSTPLAQSLNAFGDWFDTWKGPAQDEDTGDSKYICRQRYVVLITDGEDTCNSASSVCGAATRLRLQGNKVFVVGYAFGGDPSALNCIANNGGTGSTDHDGDGEADGPGPIFVNSPEELVEALTEVFVSIQQESTTVSAAAVPSVQVDVSDRLFLTEFVPVENRSVWPGRLEAFVAPLPTTPTGLPDRTKKCVGAFDSNCLAWGIGEARQSGGSDIGDVLVDDQYNPADPVGDNANQRRIYYSELREATVVGGVPIGPGGAVPAQRRFWERIDSAAPPPAAVEIDLAEGLGIDPGAANRRTQINSVIDNHLSLRTATLPDGQQIKYLLGDIFHSDPLLLQAPTNATYMALDLMGDPEVDCEQGDPDSYRCFALFHEKRRKIIAVGANDGMVHFIDAGNFHLDGAPNDENSGRFDNGTGRELFAYMPRVVMPTVKDLAVDAPTKYQYTVDGSPIAADAFIDPLHAGFGSTDPPTADQREWRTVVMGGMRRGSGYVEDLLDPDGVDPLAPQKASGYYALDVTQPDLVEALDSFGDEPPDVDLLPDTWVPDIGSTTLPPVCLAQADGTSLPAGCGPIPYGSPLWEFNDTLSGVTSDGEYAEGLRLDEDSNGWVDLAPTWSTPLLGRILVCTGTDCDPADPLANEDLEDRYVAIFGGGLDPTAPNLRGNFIYIVDLETGTTLYKREVYGSVSSRAVGQISESGYIERIYFGTTLGFVYRVDLLPEIAGVFDVPIVSTEMLEEESDSLTGILAVNVERIWEDDFEPVILFNANSESVANVVNGTAAEIRPIYIEPTLIYVLQRNANALLFGTGNREDIFEKGTPTGRFFAVVDDVAPEDLRTLPFIPLGTGDLVDTSAGTSNPDVLLDGSTNGWWLELSDDERLVGRPFAVAGILFFSTYLPTETLVTGDVCEERGLSRIYGLLTASSDPILFDDGDFVRFAEVSGLVTKPFAVPYQTQNQPKAGAGDPLTTDQQTVFEELKKLFPDQCGFPPGMRMDINVRSENTGLQRVASIPICVIESAFRQDS